MKRSEIWIASAKGPIAKPRPVVILQSDLFAEMSTVTVCAFTSDPTDGPLTRPVIAPSPSNGLKAVSRVMVERLTTIDRSHLVTRIGALDPHDMEKIQRSALLFLGFA